MLVVVNQPHTNKETRIEGYIPQSLMNFIKKEYGNNYYMEDDEGKELINPFESDWYKELKAEITPAYNIKFYRKLMKLTQSQLAEKLGTVKQDVSGMERGTRPISKNTAKKLARIFGVSVEKFI